MNRYTNYFESTIIDDETHVYDISINYDLIDAEHDESSITDLIDNDLKDLDLQIKKLEITKKLIQAKYSKEHDKELEIVELFYSKNLEGIAAHMFDNCEIRDKLLNHYYKKEEIKDICNSLSSNWISSYYKYTCCNGIMCDSCSNVLCVIDKYELHKEFHY